METNGSTPTKDLIKGIYDRRLAIEATEPPVLHILNELCWNEEAKAQGINRKNWRKISLFQALFSSFFDWCPLQIKSYGECEHQKKLKKRAKRINKFRK